jgi:hypothetical protein
MKTAVRSPRMQKFLRYTAAYSLFIFCIVLAMPITWFLRSDLLMLAAALNIQGWIFKILFTWGTFLVLVPFVLSIGLLEGYLNKAAAKGLLRERALRVLAIEGVLGLLVFGCMGILALLGFPPTL